MPGESVILGPFKGGLNTLVDPSAIGDDDLADVVNFDLDIDGSLKVRPPITIDTASGAATRLLMLGVFPVTQGPTLVASDTADIRARRGGAWSTIKAGTTSKFAAQYKNIIYVVSDGAGSGGKYDDVTWSNIAALPKGDVGAVFKERLFIGGGASQEAAGFGSRLYYSEPTNLESWPGSNFIDVGPGDGQYITGLIVQNENLIVFKNDSTYVLSYDTNPGLGTMRKISPNIGATRTFCVAQNQSEIYVLHEGWVYELINYNYSRLNTKAPFEYDPTVPVGTTLREEMFVSVFGERLICRYYNRVYVYHFIARAWTRWESDYFFGPLVKDPSEVTQFGAITYYTGNAATPSAANYKIKDAYTVTDSENMDCSVVTKVYSIAEQSRYKRLFWWGADLISDVEVMGSVIPVTDVFTISWDDLAGYSWDDLLSNSWDTPLITLPSVDTEINFVGVPRRRFVKFMKGLRFRQVQFRLTLSSDATEPVARLFNFVAYVRAKEKVVKQVS